MEEMRALVFTEPKHVQLQTMEKPTITPSEVLMEVHAFAICTMEQRAFNGGGTYPSLSGHEVCGVIREVGADVLGYKVGDKIVSTFSYCGYCDNCKRGRGSKCVHSFQQRKRAHSDTIRVGNSGMIEFAAVPASQICRVGDDVPEELAALTEPLGCCIHSVEKTRVAYGDTVVVILSLIHI